MFRLIDDLLRLGILSGLQVGIQQEVHGVQLVPAHVHRARLLGQSATDFKFAWMSSCHRPRRAKMCDGMCTACAEDDAIAAYERAAGNAVAASCGLSQE